MKPVLVRADADTRQGTGHLMRCLALAGAVRRRGGEVIFLSRCDAPDLADRVTTDGHEIRALETGTGDESDAAASIEALRGIGAEWLVADGYGFGIDYHRAIRQAGFRVLAIDDDVRLPCYDVDAVLNQNLYAPTLTYTTAPGTRLLLGTRWALLRPEFAAADPAEAVPDVARRVLVTMGGGDPHDVSRLVLEALLDADELEEITVLVGAANPYGAGIEALAKGRTGPAIRVVRDAATVADYMRDSDLAVAAAGSTCWELAALGVPALLIVTADNQVPVARSLDAVGGARDLGWWHALDRNAIRTAVLDLAGDRDERERQARVGRALVDGRGAARVAGMLAGPAGPEPRIRAAEPGDAEPLWRLANDPGVRSQAFNTDPIPLADHLAWYRKRLASPDTVIRVLDTGDMLAGQVRYDRVDAGLAEIDFAVAPERRGAGVGSRLLAETWREACEELGVRAVRGLVFAENGASAGAFLKAGFHEDERRTVEGRECRVFMRVRPEEVE